MAVLSLLLVASWLLLACNAPDDGVKTADDAWAELSARIDAQITDARVPGFQVAVVVDGELRYRGGFGVTEYGGDEAVTDDTVFRWGPVTQMHTAAAVLSLVEDGAIDLHAPVADVIGAGFELGHRVEGREITPWHLLTHTAALPDTVPEQCNGGPEVLDTYVVNEWITYAPPGTFYNYSKTGFVWLGALLEAVTGQDYLDVMQERVFAPAGMETATMDAEVAEAGPHAIGTTWSRDAPWSYAPLTEYDCGWGRPAGWLHGTATDLARTAEWQLAGGGAVLTAESVAAMHGQADTHWFPDGSYRVGYGQFAQRHRGEELVFRAGWITGFGSAWAIVPGTGFGVVVVANADWADPAAVMYDAVDLFLAPDGDTPDYTTDSETWSVYEGTYTDEHVYGRIEVTHDGGGLHAEFPDRGFSAELTQYAGDAFKLLFDDGSDTYVRFIADDSGVYRWFVTRAGVGDREAEPASEAWRGSGRSNGVTPRGPFSGGDR